MVRPTTLTIQQQRSLRETTEDLLKKNMITPIAAEYASPEGIVKKKTAKKELA
jgi:hypothetical protein